jgi:hypothetical protein
MPQSTRPTSSPRRAGGTPRARATALERLAVVTLPLTSDNGRVSDARSRQSRRVPIRISPRTQLRFAEFASGCATLRKIDLAFQGGGFQADPAPQDPGGERRTACASYHVRIDPRSDAQQRRLLNVYLDAIDAWGRARDGSLGDGATDVVRSVCRDGIPIDDAGRLTGPLPAVELELVDLHRLGDPGALDEYLERMRANIDRDTSAVFGAAKELVEATCKLILDDRGIAYAAAAPLLDLYRAVAQELRCLDKSGSGHRGSTRGDGLACAGAGRLATSPELVEDRRAASTRARYGPGMPKAHRWLAAAAA